MGARMTVDTLPPSRRAVLQAGMLVGLGFGAGMASSAALGLLHQPLRFPRDAGAHPDYQTEWWYLTGYANTDTSTAAFGFQITFFRRRVAPTQSMQSNRAARQLLFAHAALTDVHGKKLWHDQRIARWSGAEPGRNPVDTASASTQDTAVTLNDWSLQRSSPGWVTHVQGAKFSLDLRFAPSQPVLLQGDQGLSRKGPDVEQASYYYSQPQLQVSGDLLLHGKTHRVTQGSTAWMDHEWSQALLHPMAVGWDWIGINLLDGSALTAFRLRDKAGDTVWDGGSFRTGNTLTTFRRGDIVFRPLRYWLSPLSQTRYPVEWQVDIHAPGLPPAAYTVKAVVDAQELDSRQSTGAIYWEGLCEVWNQERQLAGRGYLEMTGYAHPLKL